MIRSVVVGCTHTHTQDLKEVLVESLEQEEAGRNEIEEARIMEMIESLDEKVSDLTFDLCWSHSIAFI